MVGAPAPLPHQPDDAPWRIGQLQRAEGGDAHEATGCCMWAWAAGRRWGGAGSQEAAQHGTAATRTVSPAPALVGMASYSFRSCSRE